MEQTITNFIRALRAHEVSVSSGEAIDAARTFELIGYQDRAHLKTALACVLAKSPEEKNIHDDLFEKFFMIAEARDFSANADGSGTVDQQTPDDMLSLIQSGDEAAIQMAIENAANVVEINNIRFSTQVPYFAQQMMQAMGGEAIQQKLLEALQGRNEGDQELAQEIIDARRDMFMRARERVAQAFDVFGAGETEQFRDEFVTSKSIAALQMSDMARIRTLIEKMAKRLAVKHSRRCRKRNRGMINVRRTMRANAGVDGVPFNVFWKQKKKDRPKVVAICDVSGSVAQYVRFLLMLLYALQDVIHDIDSFAFSARLGSVDDTLDTNNFDDAMKKIMREYGMGSTSYGQALSDLKMNHWNTLDKRTTVIILGDARSNHGDPRLDLFKEAAGRCKQVFWLNPEGRSNWGTGDSEMLRYAPHCRIVQHVKSLKDFEKIIDDILLSYA